MSGRIAPKPALNPRILVVEDEWLIADEIGEHLRQAGYEIVGPVPSVRRALHLIEENEVHAALLDIRLDGEDSYPIVDALIARDIPFAFLTGYSTNEIEEHCRHHPCLHKPIDAKGLLDMMETLLNGP